MVIDPRWNAISQQNDHIYFVRPGEVWWGEEAVCVSACVWMCVPMCVVWMCLCVSLCVFMCISVCARVCVYVFLLLCTCVHVCMPVYAHVFMWVCACMCMCLCVHIRVHKPTKQQAWGQTSGSYHAPERLIQLLTWVATKSQRKAVEWPSWVPMSLSLSLTKGIKMQPTQILTASFCHLKPNCFIIKKKITLLCADLKLFTFIPQKFLYAPNIWKAGINGP